MVSIEQLFPGQARIMTAFNSFPVMQTKNKWGHIGSTFGPLNQSKIWKQPVNMSKKLYKELPIVKKVELLIEARSKYV